MQRLLVLLLFALPLYGQPCDESLWKRVYHKQRLKVLQPCIEVTGTIVDATHGRRKDGQRHEADGDNHGWLAVDDNERNVLISGNISDENGDLVFECVCQYEVKQQDAIASCKNFHSKITIPPPGTRVRIRGALVTDLQHKPLHNEIHPVSSIEILK
jgi:hypothetical protein